MKKIIFTFLVLLICQNIFCQNNYANLLTKLKDKNIVPTEKVNILVVLSLEIRLRNADSAILLANEAIKIASANGYKYGLALANNALAKNFYTKSNYEEAMKYATLSLSISTEINNDSLRGTAINSISKILYNKGDYELAIAKSLEATSLFEKNKNYDAVLDAKIGLSQIYQQRKEIAKAESILKECIELQPKVNNPKFKISLLHTLANIYGMQDKFDQALALDKQGLAICDAENFELPKSEFYDNMANCYMYSGKYDLAKKYFLMCLKIDSTSNNNKQMSDTYLNLGNLYFMQKQYNSSKKYLQQSISLATIAGYKQGKFEALNLLSKTYEKINDPTNALQTMQAANTVKDSLFNEKSESKIAELEAKFESDKKEKSFQVQGLQLKNKNYLIRGLMASIFILLIIGGLLLYNYNLKKNSSKKEDIYKLAMSLSKERERFSKDLHDHLGTSLVTMIAQTDNIENKLINNEVVAALNKVKELSTQSRESMNVLRETIWAVQENSHTLAEFTLRVRTFLQRVMDAHEMAWALECNGSLQKDLSAEQTLHLFRMIQEVTQNILKHAIATHAQYIIDATTNILKISIADNGKGFDTNAIYTSNGLKNLAARIKELDGTINITSAMEKGTTIIVQLSI